MGQLDDIPINTENVEPRSPCVLLLDTSYSMSGEPIRQLNEGLRAFEEDLKQDKLASKRVETAVVTFGGRVEVIQDFVISASFSAPSLTANGDTPMGEALGRALDLVRDRRRMYKDSNLNHFRPWIFLLTDGAPTDAWESAADRIEQAEDAGEVLFFAVGVEQADFSVLRRISRKRPPIKMLETRFREMFLWISDSQKRVSSSRPGDQVQLPSRDAWEEVPA